ncbi:hypothetical protein [Desulfomonile tiedjei]|uniref:Uncharacterized protein n=1 Tax=Desulfomonile tiedjei (strain ATCC 49306 / DSM 6799 / DCB-1) TaxID=706587 RepID=I4C522_DESTA|nr:hypothetical protein [Desulfomonile tiedjei]AFM24663.1 hypothetical protein Desti_1957 [Desulfomonile tiedjei DSM 6799]
MLSQVEESEDKVRIIIPGPGFRLLMLLELAGLLVILLAIMANFGPDIVSFFHRAQSPPSRQIFMIDWGLLVFAVVLVLFITDSVLGALRRGTTVTATAREVLIEERSAWRTTTAKIHSDDILDVYRGIAQTSPASAGSGVRLVAKRDAGEYTRPKISDGSTSWLHTMLNKHAKTQGITVKTKGELFNFGAGLSDKEVCYLHWLVRRVIGISGAG